MLHSLVPALIFGIVGIDAVLKRHYARAELLGFPPLIETSCIADGYACSFLIDHPYPRNGVFARYKQMPNGNFMQEGGELNITRSFQDGLTSVIYFRKQYPALGSTNRQWANDDYPENYAYVYDSQKPIRTALLLQESRKKDKRHPSEVNWTSNQGRPLA